MDKTIRVVRGGTGAIKRISAAVVINHQTITDEKGKTTTTPLSAEQVEKMTALVRETIGFNKDRGDSVNLMNVPFATEKQTQIELPLWKQPELRDLARSLAWPVGTLLFAALVLLGVVRPALKALSSSQGSAGAAASAAGAQEGLGQAGQIDALLSEEPARPPLLGSSSPTESAAPPSSAQLRLEDARKLTRENPAAVANIVKAWMGSEAPA